MFNLHVSCMYISNGWSTYVYFTKNGCSMCICHTENVRLTYIYLTKNGHVTYIYLTERKPGTGIGGWCAGARGWCGGSRARATTSSARSAASWYRGTSLMRPPPPVGPYSSICLGPYGGPWGGGLFLMSEVPLYPPKNLFQLP